jgi:toxin YhaV
MLENGHPPDDWNDLLTEAKRVGDRLQKIAKVEP